ncbi:MAG: metallophosphoesterase [Thermoguttaceae bacterium]
MKHLISLLTVCLLIAVCLLFTKSATAQSVEEGSWSLVIIPDTQYYASTPENHGILDIMTAWIAKNKENHNILAALHVGDIVDSNNSQEASNGKLPGVKQWEAVSSSFRRLDAKVPYVMAVGNHDYGSDNMNDRMTHFNKFFPEDRNSSSSKHLVEMGDNAFGEKTLENSAYAIPLPNGKTLLVVSLEFAPSDRAVNWAKSVFDQEKYKDALGIVVTHTYIHSDGKRIRNEGYKFNDTNYGEAIWEKLIYPTDNIRLVVCGHIGAKDFQGSTAYSSDTNAAGKKVSQILFDTQFLGDKNGGDGWLRLLEFTADGNCVKAKTFSPLFDISPSTRHAAWEKSDINEYEFTLDDTPSDK